MDEFYNDGGEEDSFCEVDPSTCDPKRGSKHSCCSLNPIISSQIRSVAEERGSVFGPILSLFGSGKSCGEGNQDICLPNIGSIYVGASVASTRNTVPYKHPQGSPTSEASNKPDLVIEVWIQR